MKRLLFKITLKSLPSHLKPHPVAFESSNWENDWLFTLSNPLMIVYTNKITSQPLTLQRKKLWHIQPLPITQAPELYTVLQVWSHQQPEWLNHYVPTFVLNNPYANVPTTFTTRVCLTRRFMNYTPVFPYLCSATLSRTLPTTALVWHPKVQEACWNLICLKPANFNSTSHQRSIWERMPNTCWERAIYVFTVSVACWSYTP